MLVTAGSGLRAAAAAAQTRSTSCGRGQLLPAIESARKAEYGQVKPRRMAAALQSCWDLPRRGDILVSKFKESGVAFDKRRYRSQGL